MIDFLIQSIESIPWFAIVFIAFLLAFIENVFPPSPSDTLIVFIGSQAALLNQNLFILIIITTIGSVIGFYLMFYWGSKFENYLDSTTKIKFINRDTLHKIENWFSKWGYLIIVFNRAMSGTRGAISFFAGMSKLQKKKTLIYATVSAFVWNLMLVFLGYSAGKQWAKYHEKLKEYETILVIILASIMLIFILKMLLSYIKSNYSKTN